ncbi:MAG: hypothetical protein ACI9K3_000375 [Halovenus sp.]|jgi:hypothetical protein
MADTRQLRQTLAAYNEEGQLYIVVGGLAAIVGWLVPLLSAVAILCGHKLLSGDRHRLVGAAIMGFGVLAFFRLVLMMLSVL